MQSHALRTEPAVRCRGVTKTYGVGAAAVIALRGIDLDVHTDELLMLVGPSGCGKTTLISVIAGILDQNDGQCTVFGNDFKNMSQSAKTRRRGELIGFVFQSFNLLPTLTAAENVAIPLLLNGVRRTAAIERAKEILARVGLGDRTRSLPAQLSGGQQQRVAIARAMDTGHKVMELLRQVARAENRALIIVTHDARIFSFADRIAKMDDGHIVQVARSAEEVYGNEAAETRKLE